MGLTRIRRENPAFNYGFFRPNPLAFERQARKNAGHGSDFTGPGSSGQAEIARSGSGRNSAQTFQYPHGAGVCGLARKGCSDALKMSLLSHALRLRAALNKRWRSLSI